MSIRWAPQTDSAERAELEARFGLFGGEPEDSATWRYRLRNPSRSNVAALVSHPSVADTHKIDRGTFEIETEVPSRTTLGKVVPFAFGWSAIAWLAFALRGIGWSAAAWLWSCLRRLLGGLMRVSRDALFRAIEPRGPHPSIAPWETAVDVVLGLAFLAPLLVYGPWDNEESGLGIFSSQIFYRDLVHGRWTFWLNDLGFGTALPIGQRLDFHPVFALGSLASLRLALSGAWVLHVAVMTVYFRRLAALLGVGPLVRTALTACYVSSAPSVNYFYATDWLSHVMGWSLYPVLAYYVHRMVTEPSGRRPVADVFRLALVGAFWVLNSHPGYIAPLALILTVYTVLVARPRAAVYACLSAAAALCAAACAERTYFFLSELSFFPQSLPRAAQSEYTLYQYARAAAAPFAQMNDEARAPFIGLVAGVAAVVSLARPLGIVGTRAAGVCFLLAAALSLTPVSLVAPLKVFSGVWFFRDPMVLFGLLSAGIALQRGIDARRVNWRLATVAFLFVQLLQQGAAVRPAYQLGMTRKDNLRFYRYQGAPVRMAGTLVDRARTYGPRLYMTEPVRGLLLGRLSDHGIHSMTDLVLFGLNPINGGFKNVSMDRLHPSEQLMHGVIMGQNDVIAHQPLLNVLGINLVWANLADGPFSTAMVPTDRWPLTDVNGAADQPDLVLLGNPQAWPRAVLLPEPAGRAALPLRPQCPHQGALCGDFSSLERQRLPEPVTLTETDGFYAARFAPADSARLLFISATYRPEWQAGSAAGPLPVEPAAGAFLGVVVPPGIGEVEVRFVPRARMVLAWVSYGTIATLVAAVCIDAWRRRRRPPTVSP